MADEKKAPTARDRYLHILSGEEAAHHVVDTVLTEGGQLLWESLLRKKAFPFSANVTSENLVAHLKMCFVPHDTKSEELAAESEDDERWDLEEEPVANRIDSWARMHLQTKRRVRLDAKMASAGGDALSSQRSAGRASTLGRGKAASGKKEKKGVKELESRTKKIVEDVIIDEEEDRYRDLKEREEKKKREDEARQRVLDREREDARRKLEALHEEMKVRQFTYDSLGNLIWVEAPNVDRLPKVTEQCPYGLRETKQKKDTQMIELPPAPLVDPKDKKKMDKRKTRKGGKMSKQEELEMMGFTDNFTRLQHEQPPIIDTMEVRPGVDLEFQGKAKKGARPEGQQGQMSRLEYKQLIEGEGGDFSMGAGDDASSAAKDETTLDMSVEKDSADRELPPLRGAPSGAGQAPAAKSSARRQRVDSDKSATFSASAPAGDSNWGQTPEFVKENIVRLPPAPSFALRSKRETVGHLGRNPRLHLGPLGQSHGYRAPQPVLGATMGHGLMRAGSLKEGFFFPDQEADMTRMANRSRMGQSKSETTLNSSWGSRPASTLYEQLPPLGNIHSEKKSKAYQNVRTLMGFGNEFDAYKSQEVFQN